MPCKISLVNLTRLSRAPIVLRVYAAIILPSHVLRGVERIITPRLASPAGPMKW